MLPYFNTCIGVYKIVTECSPEVIMTYNCNIFLLFRPYCWWLSHNYNVLNDRSVPIHVLQLVGRIDHGAGAPFDNRGEWSSTEQGEREIRAISPAQCCEANQSHTACCRKYVSWICISRRRMHSANILDCSIDCNTVLNTQPQQQVNSTHC